MTSLVFLFFTYFSETLIVYSYINHIYKSKKNNFSSLFITLSLYMALIVIYRYITTNEIIHAVLIVVLNILLIFLLFESSIKSAVFHSIILCILQYISEVVSVYVMALSFNLSSEKIVEQHFEIATILSRVLYLMLCKFLERFTYKENKSNSWGRWFALSILPISSVLIILSIRKLTTEIALTPSQNFICMGSLFILLVANIVIYAIYEHAEISNQRLLELEILNQKNDIDLKYLSLLEKKNEQMQIMSHDYKNNLLSIEAMSTSEDIKEFIQSMVGEISNNSQIGKTKNRFLDVILNKYIDICNEKDIDFKNEIINDNLSFFSNYDMSTLFNNILDNAVESAETSTNPFIYLNISNVLNSYHKITVINSCDIEPNAINGHLVTTKNNKNIHGFGTKSISKVVNKYDGELQWDYDKTEKSFKLTILIPINIA